MPWYLVLMNVLFAAIVFGGIVGSQLWAILSSRSDSPAPPRSVATKTRKATPEPAMAA